MAIWKGIPLKGELEWIISKSMRKNKADRYASAADLESDIQNFLRGNTLAAGPDSTWYIVRKFVRRNRGRVSTAALALLLLGIGSLFYIHGIRAEQRKAEKAQHIAESAEEREAAAKQQAIIEAHNAQHAAAVAETRYLTQQELLPLALPYAKRAYSLGGKWEDGNLYNEIYKLSRRDWSLVAAVDLDTPPICGTFVAVGNTTYLAVAQPGGLRVFDAMSGAYLGSRRFEQAITLLVPSRLPGGPLLVCCGKTAVLVHVPDLAICAQRTFPNPITDAVSSNISFLLLEADHSADAVKKDDLSDLAVLHAGDFKFDSEHPAFQSVAISPNGSIAVLHGGHWNTSGVVWHLASTGLPTQQTQPTTAWVWHEANDIRYGPMAFVNDRTLVTWFAPAFDGSQPDEVNAYALDSVRPRHVLLTHVPSTATKGTLKSQAWTTPDGWMLGFSGRSGCVSLNQSTSDIRETRYMNLLPFADSTEFLCSDFEQGCIALTIGNEVKLFHRPMQGTTFHANYHMSGFNAAVTKAGLLTGHYEPYLDLTPADPTQHPQVIHYDWLKEDHWILWNFSATPDAKRMVLIAQKSSGKDTTSDTFSNTVARIYNIPDVWPHTNLPVTRQIPLENPAPASPWQQRVTVLAGDPAILFYWTDAGVAARYSTVDGRMLSKDELGRLARRSPDGQLVAGTDDQGNLRIMNIRTGEVRTFHLDILVPLGLCFDNNASHLYVADRSKMECIDVVTGVVLWSRGTDLIPIAWPVKGDQFVAFQYDRESSGGNIILADTVTFETVAVLSHNASIYTWGLFDDTERTLYLAQGRWTAEVIHDFSPEEIKIALNDPQQFPRSPQATVLPPLLTVDAHSDVAPSTEIDASDPDALKKHLNQDVVVVGYVTAIRFAPSQNALSLEFDSSSGLMGWISPENYRAFDQAFGGNGAVGLLSHRIRVAGHLTEFHSRPEIILSDPQRCIILNTPTKSRN